MTKETSSDGVVLHKHQESRQGSAVRVDRLELTKAGVSLLTATIKSIPAGRSTEPADNVPSSPKRTGTSG